MQPSQLEIDKAKTDKTKEGWKFVTYIKIELPISNTTGNIIDLIFKKRRRFQRDQKEKCNL